MSTYPDNQVAADMERIFKPLEDLSLKPAFWHDVHIQETPVKKSSGWRWAAVTVSAVLLLIAAVLVTAYEHSYQGAAASPIDPITDGKRFPRAVKAAASTQDKETASVRSSLAQIDASIPSDTCPKFNRQPGGEISSLRQSSDASKASQTLAPPASLHAPKRFTSYVAIQSELETGSRLNARLPIVDTRCLPESSTDECIYQDVLNADTRLRRVYDRASQAGVSKSTLPLTIKAWNQARKGLTVPRS